MKSISTIHHDIINYLEDVSRWENETLKVIGNNKYIFKNNNWEEVEVYELRPTYSRPPLFNPDGTRIDSEIVNKKPN